MDLKYLVCPYIQNGENVGVGKYATPNIDIIGSILHPWLQKWIASSEEECKLHEKLSGPKIIQIKSRKPQKVKCQCDSTTRKGCPLPWTEADAELKKQKNNGNHPL